MGAVVFFSFQFENRNRKNVSKRKEEPFFAKSQKWKHHTGANAAVAVVAVTAIAAKSFLSLIIYAIVDHKTNHTERILFWFVFFLFVVISDVSPSLSRCVYFCFFGGILFAIFVWRNLKQSNSLSVATKKIIGGIWNFLWIFWRSFSGDFFVWFSFFRINVAMRL